MSSSASSLINIPSEDDLLQSAKTNNIVEFSHQILHILDTVNRDHDSMDVEVETAAKAIDVLTGTKIIEHEHFVTAFSNAVWMLSSSSSSAKLSAAAAAAAAGNKKPIIAEQPKTNKTTLISVLKAVCEHCNSTTTGGGVAPLLLGPALLERVADVPLLTAIGLIPNSTDLSKRVRVVNTAIHYRQHKFNLLYEESEGYAKLLYILHHPPSPPQQSPLPQKEEDDSSPSSSSKPIIMDMMTEQISALIGTYSLDPNRCLDIAVDVLEYELEKQKQQKREAEEDEEDSVVAVRLQRLQMAIRHLATTGKLACLLGFKLRHNHSKKELNYVAWLCHKGLVDASEMVAYLPDDEQVDYNEKIEELYEAHFKQEKQRIQTLGRVRLGGASGDNERQQQKAKEIDLKPLRDLLFIQLLEKIIELGGWENIRNVLSADQWSKIIVLFPQTIGAPLLDWVSGQISDYVPPTPFSTTKEIKDIKLAELLDTITEPLEYTRAAGCIALRPMLYTQVCRVLARYVHQDVKDDSLVQFLHTFLIPSVSVFSSNPAVTMEAWQVVKHLDYQTRYDLYRSWRGSGLERAALKSDKPLWLIEGELLIGKDARYALKRLSKDTIRDMSRAVAKCCHSHPLVIFTTILGQIESYDNMVQVMVDACHFVTPMSLDVLGFCILERLSGSAGGVNRSRLKENGVNVSQWLQSLESFTGAFYKRYPSVEFQGILRYLMNRLQEGQVMELGVLRTLLKAGGWGFADYAPVASLNATQLEGRAGSTSLQRETMAFGVVERINVRASNKVRRVLQTDNLGVSLLILLAQVRHQIVFEKSNRPKPVKLIGNLVDTCQVVMSILLDFLTNETQTEAQSSANCETEAIKEYSSSLPSLAELFEGYKVETASAWMLARPRIRASLGSSTDESEALDIFKPMLPESTWASIGLELFKLFFTSTLFDIHCPEATYGGEIARLEKEIERLSAHKDNPQQAVVQPGVPHEFSDEQEMERIKKVLVDLKQQLSQQKVHVAKMLKQVESNLGRFFVQKDVSRKSAMAFFVRCVYPRCMQGPDDAMFCSRFVNLLHKHGTSGFGTLHYFDALIVILSRSLFCMTESEAACASILLVETWKTVSRWRYNEDAFLSEVVGKPGSFMVVPVETGEEIVAVSHKAFAKLYNKWHAALGATCVGCLQSAEYMHLRNCLIVLTRMVDEYPTRPKLANRLLSSLEPLQAESNSLADIRASAQAYSMQLIKARDDGVWKEEDAATVKARQKKAKADAAERQKKAEEQMAEIKRDSEKITDQIGEQDYRDRGRGRHHHGDQRRNYDHDDSRGTEGRQVKVYQRNAGIRTPPPPRDPTQHISQQQQQQPQQQPDHRWQQQRDRAPTIAGSYASIAVDPASGGHRDEGGRLRQADDGQNRGLEGRWQRAASDREQLPGGGRKRSRPGSPVEQGESREDHQQSTKRSRANSDDDDGGRRRAAGPRRRTGGRR